MLWWGADSIFSESNNVLSDDKAKACETAWWPKKAEVAWATAENNSWRALIAHENAKAKKVVEYITAERSKETVKNISEEEDEESNIDDAFDVVGWKKGPTELGLLAALTASPPSVWLSSS